MPLGSSIQDEPNPPARQNFFLPELPLAPTRVTPDCVADAADALADRIRQYQGKPDAAIKQREGIETELTGEALEDKYPIGRRDSPRDDAQHERRGS